MNVYWRRKKRASLRSEVRKSIMPRITNEEGVSPEWTLEVIKITGRFFIELREREIVMYHNGTPKIDRPSSYLR